MTTNYILTRRDLSSKSPGLGSIMLAASPLSALGRTAAKPFFLNVFPLHTDEWHAIFHTKISKPIIKTGDRMRFLPELHIDGFEPIPDKGHYFFNHIFGEDFTSFKAVAAPYQDRFKSLSTSDGCPLPTYRLRII